MSGPFCWTRTLCLLQSYTESNLDAVGASPSVHFATTTGFYKYYPDRVILVKPGNTCKTRWSLSLRFNVDKTLELGRLQRIPERKLTQTSWYDRTSQKWNVASVVLQVTLYLQDSLNRTSLLRTVWDYRTTRRKDTCMILPSISRRWVFCRLRTHWRQTYFVTPSNICSQVTECFTVSLCYFVRMIVLRNFYSALSLLGNHSRFIFSLFMGPVCSSIFTHLPGGGKDTALLPSRRSKLVYAYTVYTVNSRIEWKWSPPTYL